MKESPIYQEIVLEGIVQGERNSIIKVLTARFNQVPEGIRRAIEAVEEVEELDRLLEWATRCQSLEEFSEHLMGVGVAGGAAG